MQAVLEVLRQLDADGPANLEDLCSRASDDVGLCLALDVAVDHGLVRLAGHAHGAGVYRLTRRGRKFLTLAQTSQAAA